MGEKKEDSVFVRGCRLGTKEEWKDRVASVGNELEIRDFAGAVSSVVISVRGVREMGI